MQREPTDNQFKLVWRESATGPDRLIVDPEALAKTTGTPHAVMDFTPSPDGKKIAYALQAGGGEIGTLHVLDLASGKRTRRADRPHPLRERELAAGRLGLLLLAPAREVRVVPGRRALRRSRAPLPPARRPEVRPQRLQPPARRRAQAAALRRRLRLPDPRLDARRQPGVPRRRALSPALPRQPRRGQARHRELEAGHHGGRPRRRHRHRRRLRLRAFVEARAALRGAAHAARAARTRARRERHAGERERRGRPGRGEGRALRHAPRRRDAFALAHRAQAGREAAARRAAVRRRDRAHRRFADGRRRRVRDGRLDARDATLRVQSLDRPRGRAAVRHARRLRRAGRHHGARDPLQEPRRRRGPDVDRDAQGREARRLEPDHPLRLRRLRRHRGSVPQPALVRVGAARRHPRLRARARRRRLRRGVAHGRPQADQAEHLEGRDRRRRVPAGAGLHEQVEDRHLRRQRRRHLRRPRDHRASRPLRRRGARGRHVRRDALRVRARTARRTSPSSAR